MKTNSEVQLTEKVKFDTRMHSGVCQGVSAQGGGVSAQGGVCPGGGVWQTPHPGPEADIPPGTDRHL